MRILLLNQFIPPDPAPTSRLLGDVGEELEKRGHEVVWVGNESNYHGKKTLLGSRALRELSELGKLLFKGWTSPPCRKIVFLSSPPFLPVIATMIALRHSRADLVHWAMDVYPDVAIALGETAEDSLIAKVTSNLMAKSYRSCKTVIALDEDMADRIGVHGVHTTLQTPWPPEVDQSKAAKPHRPERFRILYSGNLGRAHDWKTILDALATLEKEGVELEMIFQGGGGEREDARAYAESLQIGNCRWEPYVDNADLLPSLLAADVLLITQREETKGCIWPSKLALSALTGIPILWIGPRESAVTDWLQKEGHPGFQIGDAKGVTDFLRTKATERETQATEKRSIPDIIEASRDLSRKGRNRICDQIEGVSP